MKNSLLNESNPDCARRILVLGALLCGLAVALGAFGAHGLEGRLSERGLTIWDLGVRYQMWHGFAILAVGLLHLHRPVRGLRLAALLFFLGILFFSGSLYVLAFVSLGKWALLTPLGGSLFLAAWVWLAVCVKRALFE